MRTFITEPGPRAAVRNGVIAQPAAPVSSRSARAFAAILATVLLAGCADPAPGARDTLRIAVLPDQKKQQLQRIYEPLVRHLGTALGTHAELVLPDSYEDLLERFGRGEVDLAYFGAATFIAAERRYGANPLAMRHIDRHFNSCVIVPGKPAGKFPDDFRGKKLVFGPEKSTSGHLMPRHFFSQMGLVPEQYFSSVSHAAGHDASIRAVESGQADLAAVNCQILAWMTNNKLVNGSKFSVAWQSPVYADYVWAVPANIPEEMRNRLLGAFLLLDATDAGHRRIMDNLAAEAYVPATRSAFDVVRKVISGDSEGGRHAAR